jgi:hypothetical protein
MRKTVIYFNAESATFQIVLERLADLPLTNISKLFKLLFASAWNHNNRRAIDAVSLWFPTALENAKTTWGMTAVEFDKGWRDLKSYAIELPPKDRKKAVSKQRQLNQFLTTALRNAKTDYERLVKIQAIFNEIRESPR